MVRLTLLLIYILSFTACSLDASISFLQKDSPSVLQKSEAIEFVSGSTQFQQTAGTAGNGRYRVQASLGSWHGDTFMVTPRQYRVFTSVQGQMISQEEANP